VSSDRFQKAYEATSEVLKTSLMFINELDVVSEEIPRAILLFSSGTSEPCAIFPGFCLTIVSCAGQLLKSSDFLGFVDKDLVDFTLYPIGLGNATNPYIVRSPSRYD